MPTRTTRTAAVLAVLATGGLVLGVAPAAQAATPTPVAATTGCIPASTSGGTTSAHPSKAQIATISHCIAGLAKQADKAATAAQVADEHYLREKLAAQTASVNAQRAADRAAAAQVQAQKSRDRMAAVSAYMARTGQGDQATAVMLDGTGASKTLYNLSRVSQLTVDSSQIAQQAADDSATAKLLGAQAADALTAAQARAAAAKTDFAAAKKTASDAAELVSQQLAQEQALAAASDTTLGTDGSVKVDAPVLPANASKAARALAFARAQIGDPYVFAAAGPNAWDCSGLTMGAYASVGIGIGGHSATAQYDLARAQGKLVPYADAEPGDLIFYTDGGGDMYHVTMYSGHGMMVEAPQEGENVREVPVRGYQMVGMVARPSA